VTIYLLALAIGVVSGLRAMTPPAAVSWAARLGILPVGGTWLGWLASAWAPWVFTALAAIELVTDQLPKTPSRKVPVQFGARILTGALGGAAIGTAAQSWVAGAVLGVLGAVIGTFGGAKARGALAERFGRDLPAALIEDAVALGGAALIVLSLR
jgi:uncharacterized membrane protein